MRMMMMIQLPCVDEERGCMRKGKALCGRPGSYLGFRNATLSGRQCQAWDAQTPHAHAFGSTHGGHNFCRVDGVLGPWCLTTDPAVKWEYCFPVWTPSLPLSLPGSYGRHWQSCPDCVVEKRDCALRGQAICRQEDGYQVASFPLSDIPLNLWHGTGQEDGDGVREGLPALVRPGAPHPQLHGRGQPQLLQSERRQRPLVLHHGPGHKMGVLLPPLQRYHRPLPHHEALAHELSGSSVRRPESGHVYR